MTRAPRSLFVAIDAAKRRLAAEAVAERDREALDERDDDLGDELAGREGT